MKKSISMLLAALMLTGALSGCGGSSSSDSSDSQASGNDSGVSGAITVISREDGSGTRGAFIELTGVEEKNDAGEDRQYHRGCRDRQQDRCCTDQRSRQREGYRLHFPRCAE